MQYLLSVDIGTTSTKVVAFSVKGKVLASEHKGYEILHPQEGYSEQEPEAIFAAVSYCITEVYSKMDAAAELAGISFSCAMHSLAAIDEDSRPLTNFMIWADNRAAAIAERLQAENKAHKLYEKTGTPVHPMSPLCKLIWLRENKPEIFSKAAKFIGIKEYLFKRFCGQYLIDQQLASATGLYNIHQLQWDNSALKEAAVPETKLPEVVSPFHKIKIMDAAAQLLGLPQDTLLIAGGADGCLANLGEGATDPSELVITLGTSGAVRLTQDHAYLDEKMRSFCYLLTEDRYVAGGAVNNGGIVMEWYHENIFPAFKIAELEASAREVAPGSDGLLFLPYLLGERTPINDPHARAVFFGLNIHTKQPQLTRAVMEGVALSLCSAAEILLKQHDVKKIRAGGGATHSGLWMQIFADVFGLPVEISDSSESSALGAAVIGLKALDIIDDINKVKEINSVSAVYRPDNDKHELYRHLLQRFKKLYQALKPAFVQ